MGSPRLTMPHDDYHSRVEYHHAGTTAGNPVVPLFRDGHVTGRPKFWTRRQISD